jgi:hypothetical protein
MALTRLNELLSFLENIHRISQSIQYTLRPVFGKRFPNQFFQVFWCLRMFESEFEKKKTKLFSCIAYDRENPNCLLLVRLQPDFSPQNSSHCLPFVGEQ